MARLDSKQLNPALTGSFTLSGSFTGDSRSTGSFGTVNVNGDDFNTAVSKSAVIGGFSGGGFGTFLRLSGSESLTGSLLITQHGGASGNLEVEGNISSSATSTGSFGRVNASRVYNVNRIEDDGSELTIRSDDLKTVGDAITIKDSSGSDKITFALDTSAAEIGGSLVFNNSLSFASDLGAKISGSSTSTGSFGVLELDTGGNLRGVVSFTHGELQNTVIGYAGTGQSLDSSGGRQNTLIGYSVGGQITTGDQNVAIGQENLSQGNSTGNTAIGYRALKQVTTGIGNVGVGRLAGDTVQSGNFNIAIGQSADFTGTGATNQIAIGYDVTVPGDNQTVIGASPQTHVIFGGSNTLISGSAGSTGSFGEGNFTNVKASNSVIVGDIADNTAELHISGSGNQRFTIQNNTATAKHTLTSDEYSIGTTTDDTLTLSVNNSIVGRFYSSATNKTIELGSGVSTGNSQLWIDGDSGNVGIGTRVGGVGTPSAKLHVIGDIKATGDVIAENYIVSSSVVHLTQSFSSGSTIFGDTADDVHEFVGDTISGSSTSTGSFGSGFFDGRVGIYQKTPTAELHISSPSSQPGIRVDGAYANIQIEGDNLAHISLKDEGATSGERVYQINSDGGILAFNRTNDAISSVTATPLKLKDDKVEVLNISGSSTSTGSFGKLQINGKDIFGDSDGIGLGTSNPSAQLHLFRDDSTTDTTNGILIEQDGTGDAVLQFLLTGTKRYIMGIDNSNGDAFRITPGVSDISSGTIHFSYGPTGVLALEGSTARIGVGTDSPNVQLDVRGFGHVEKKFGVGFTNKTPDFHLEVHGDAFITGSISGSATSTGSFSRVEASNVNISVDSAVGLTVDASSGWAGLRIGGASGQDSNLYFGDDTNGFRIMEDASESTLSILSGGSDRTFNLKTAQIGINTQTPQGTLDVTNTGVALLDIVSDSGASSGDTDVALRFFVDGVSGTGTQKGLVRYNQGDDIFGIGYGSNDHLKINSSGNLEVAGNVSGSAISTGSFGVIRSESTVGYSLFRNQVYVHLDGSASTPSINVMPQSGNGFYKYASNEIGVTTNGTATARFSSTAGLEMLVGNVSGSSTSTASFGHFIGDGSGLENVFEGTAPSASISTRLTNTEATASSFIDGTAVLVSGSAISTGSFGRLEADVVEAKQFVVSSSVTNIVTIDVSGSTEFGDTLDDTHRFTGSVHIQSGSLDKEVHIVTNTDRMFIGRFSGGIPVSGSENISRFVTGADGSVIDVGFTTVDDDGNTVLTTTGDGVHVNDRNYWYNSEHYRIGSHHQFLKYDTTDVSLKGQVVVTTGSYDGEMFINTGTSGSIGSMFIGKYTGGIPVSGSDNISRYATGSDGSIVDVGFTTVDDDGNTVLLTTGDGIFVDSNNYWYTTGHFKVGNSNNFINWNTSNLNISGTFSGDGSALTGISAASLPAGVLSGSAQISSDISGSFTALSSSLAARISVEEAEGGGGGSFTAAGISGSFTSGDFSFTNVSGSAVSTGSFGSLALGNTTAKSILNIKSREQNSLTNGIEFIAANSSNVLFRVFENNTDEEGELQLFKGSDEKVRLRADGNNFINGGDFGIGNSTPDSFYNSKLVVGAGASEENLTLYAGGTNPSGLFFADSTSGNGRFSGQIYYNHGTDKMQFATGYTGASSYVLELQGNKVSGSAASTGSFGVIEVGGGHFTSASLASGGSGGGGGSMDDVVDDTSPQLGGNLDLNSNDITGTGNINIVGNISGSASSTGSFGHAELISSGDALRLRSTGAAGSANTVSLNFTTNAHPNATRNVYFDASQDTNNYGTLTIGAYGNVVDSGGYSDVLQISATDNIKISGSATSTGSFGKLEVGSQIRLIEGGDSFVKGGDFGIGTNTPVARLEIEDDGTSNSMLLKLTSDDSNVYGMVVGNDTFSTNDTNGGQHILGNDGTYIMRAIGSSTAARIGAGTAWNNYKYLEIDYDTDTAEFTTTKISGSIASTGSFGAVITPTDGHIVGNMVEIIKVTVVDDGGNHFAFEGATTPNLVVSEGKTYRFDQSDSTNDTHPFAFSLTEEGSTYTTGVTTVGTPGDTGAYTEIRVTKATANRLFYKCTAHSGMGNQGNILKNDLTNFGGNISGSASSTGSFGTVEASHFTGDGAGLANVPDYVFEPEYVLRPLSDVETFVSQSKHLPGIPGMDEMSEWKKYSVGDRDMLLLEKIEELTLYVIRLEKRIKDLENN